MQGVTLTIAFIFAILVLTLRPPYNLAAYITALLWYPAFLPVSVGTIDILVGRLVVFVLLLRCVCDDRLRGKFVWCRLDTVVSLSMLVYVGIALFGFTLPLESTLENRGGFLMDTWCAYMAARFIITDRAGLVSMMKWVSVVLVPLALLGVVESFTGWQPFAPLWRYSPWFREDALILEGRFGFTRAVGPFSHAILFGGGFAMFLPLVYYLRHEKNYWRSLAYVLSGVAFLGALSCMSSGPWVMALAVVFCLALEKRKDLLKPLVVFFVFLCISIGLASNRPFYHVVATRIANPMGGAGWHRARLLDLAIERFDEWWLLGYGEQDPGWGPELGMDHTDVTNEFILAGVRYGIWGVIALCAVLVVAFSGISDTYRKATDPRLKSLCWVFGSLLFSVVVAWMSVSFFGQLISLFYCVLGMIGSLCSFGVNWEVPNRLPIVQHYSMR